jgi:hypothetical protein
MTFFGDLFEVAGGGAGGFAAGMRAQREQQLERDNLRMREAEMEAAAVDRSLMRGIQQQQVQLAEEEFQYQRAMDRRESLRNRIAARDGAAQQQFENELALAREGFDPSGNPLSYDQLPLPDQSLIDQRRASAANSLRGTGAGRQFSDADRGLAQQVLHQFGQRNRDSLDYAAMEQRARDIAQERGMDPAAVLNALNAVTGEYLLGRMTMDPVDRMMEGILPDMSFNQLLQYDPQPSTLSGGQVGGDVTLSGNLPPEVQAAIDELVAQGITDPNEVMAELSKRGLGN